jgi:hypothetical protein
MKGLWGGHLARPYVPHQNEMCCMIISSSFVILLLVNDLIFPELMLNLR